MKFMRDGMARRAHEADAMADAVRAELQRVDSDSEADEDASTPQQEPSGVTAERVNGRMIFAPGTVSCAILMRPSCLPQGFPGESHTPVHSSLQRRPVRHLKYHAAIDRRCSPADYYVFA